MNIELRELNRLAKAYKVLEQKHVRKEQRAARKEEKAVFSAIARMFKNEERAAAKFYRAQQKAVAKEQKAAAKAVAKAAAIQARNEAKGTKSAPVITVEQVARFEEIAQNVSVMSETILDIALSRVVPCNVKSISAEAHALAMRVSERERQNELFCGKKLAQRQPNANEKKCSTCDDIAGRKLACGHHACENCQWAGIGLRMIPEQSNCLLCCAEQIVRGRY